MPHRAGYFVLAYSWDHHCDHLTKSLRAGFEKARSELADLLVDDASALESLLNYYKKWHYNRGLYDRLLEVIGGKVHTIKSLGYRGYGVNVELADALEGLEKSEREPLGNLVHEAFLRKAHIAKGLIYLPQECIDGKNSEYVITELCRKLGRDSEGEVPYVFRPVSLDLNGYFTIMSKETSWQANTAIFQRLFLKMGLSSATIMSGSTGLHNRKSPLTLKKMANENFRATFRYIFETLHVFTPIGLDLLKHIHYLLSLGLDLEAGRFRQIDFPDRNGVTFEFGNFQREVGDLSSVLSETAQSFHDLNTLIYNLARSYYMLIGIHPFWDSNGRVGRAFINQILMKKGLPPISFHDAEEIFALPRYGGTMEDMHNYIRARIMKGVQDYFYERKKLDSSGLLSCPIYNVSFESGFTFYKIDQGVQRLVARFEALVMPEEHPLSAYLRDGCRVVLPNDFALYNMTVYYGFSRSPTGPWSRIAKGQHNLSIVERESEIAGARVFDVEFTVELGEAEREFPYFSCTVAYEEAGLLFNNRGLNYSYRLER